MKTFGLGSMTLGSIFKKPETVLYPFEKRESPEGLRGTVEIEAADCIFCGMCARSCPCGAIEVERKARTWTIERMQCVQCGSCTRNCPKGCLSMAGELPQAAARRAPVIVQGS